MTNQYTRQVEIEGRDKPFMFDVTFVFIEGDKPYLTPSAHEEPACEHELEIWSVFYQGVEITDILSGSEMEDIATELYEMCLQEFTE